MPRKSTAQTLSRPMLAVAVDDVASLKYPILVTPKLDGIRCLVVNGRAMTRKFKPIPNRYIRDWIERNCPNGFDGEIMLRGSKDFNKIQSEVMSEDGEPNFDYWVFDYVREDLKKPYCDRMQDLREWMATGNMTKIVALLPTTARTPDDLLMFEKEYLLDGYEGAMIRDPNGPYKVGRSTLREGYLLKLKRFQDAEAQVIGMEEQMHNANVQKENELGLMKRSTAKDGLVPAGTLGALIVRDCKTGIEFKIGTGMDDALRAEIWANQLKYLDKLVTYKFQPTGVKEKPRFPVFKGFRSADDLS